MADQKEQVKPLAPAVSRLFLTDQEEEESKTNHHNSNGITDRRRKHCIQCFGCGSAILAVAAVTMIVLSFTVFHVRAPIVRMNSIASIGGLSSDENNVTLVAGFSVKNPNAASFRYGVATTTVFYGGAAVGEGRIPAGVARARRTVLTNVTVEISIMASSLRLTGGDVASGSLIMESLTRIGGRVKIVTIVKKTVVVKLNCNITYNISSQKIKKRDCKHDVNI